VSEVLPAELCVLLEAVDVSPAELATTPVEEPTMSEAVRALVVVVIATVVAEVMVLPDEPLCSFVDDNTTELLGAALVLGLAPPVDTVWEVEGKVLISEEKVFPKVVLLARSGAKVLMIVVATAAELTGILEDITEDIAVALVLIVALARSGVMLGVSGAEEAAGVTMLDAAELTTVALVMSLDVEAPIEVVGADADAEVTLVIATEEDIGAGILPDP
jgi:hypothetical protein